MEYPYIREWDILFLNKFATLLPQVLNITEKEDFDMDAVTEDNMVEMMEKMEQSFIDKSLKNEGLCKRLVGLAMEAKDRNII